MNQPTEQPSTGQPDGASIFGSAASSYDRGRPHYPEAAVEWLLPGPGVAVLELGAGTGKLTKQLLAQGHDVHAIEPDESMLAVLREHLPQVKADQGRAEAIPVPDRSVDVVVVAQAWHWFDREAALAEVVRVLKPGGQVSLVWNLIDTRIPWARKLSAIIGSNADPSTLFAGSSAGITLDSPDFGELETAEFKHWHEVNRETITDLVASRSQFLAADSDQQRQQSDAVLALYDDYGRGHDGMQLPYLTKCFRSRLLPHVHSGYGPDAGGGAGSTGPSHGDPEDTDLLLIDFR